MATRIPIRPRPEIEYPDSDGRPIADNTLQFRWIVTIKEGLEAQYVDESRVFVAGDRLWYPVEGNNRIRTAPDTLVAFGRPKGERGSYQQWAEGGIAPQVVFEILTPGNRAGELKRRFQFYERFGVEEYYIYDPDHGDLNGWLRQGSELKEIPQTKGFISPRLRIRFEPGPGPDNLTIIGRDGRPFVSVLEMFKQREAERLRADETEWRRKTAEQRAETSEQRAERLAAKLRELGIDPD